MPKHKPRAQRLDEVEDAIALHWRRHGCSPSQDKIADMVEISDRTTVSGLIRDLIAYGRVARASGRHGVILTSDREIIRDALRGKEWR